jgi:5-methylcytosine-specific restriction endonuclease McrA
VDKLPSKACKFCMNPKPTHWPYQCKVNPKVILKSKVGKRRTPIKKIGKQTKQWFITRATWIRKNPPDENGYYYCYLKINEWCPGKLTVKTMTLDHIVSRSHDPKLRFSLSNLKPACKYCNLQKGSRSLDQL